MKGRSATTSPVSLTRTVPLVVHWNNQREECAQLLLYSGFTRILFWKIRDICVAVFNLSLTLPNLKPVDNGNLPVCWLMLITECNVLSSCNVSLCSDLSSESGGPWPKTLVLAWWELRIKNSMINYHILTWYL